MKRVADGLFLALILIGIFANGLVEPHSGNANDAPSRQSVPKVAHKNAEDADAVGAQVPIPIDAQQQPAGLFQARQDILVQQAARLTEPQIEQMIFRQDRNAARARERLATELARQIEVVDRVCKLTEAQRNKLNLMGRGDIKHFFNRFEPIKQEAPSIDRTAPEFRERWREISLEINALRTTLQIGLFNADSLFSKSLSNTLTSEQLARYDANAASKGLAPSR